ncbi:type II toxin-antitoxin system RelE/ParE family toxin [Ectothiorhodospira mobilis]|uniref:Proteic killer suppression protein n=1 Tax=Ectothiorhodospira mobilis TaxID=195064 RepID=A0A1I4SXN4_ECTMO|nr:type II toxin-antitoxin system RelE/ParE family toxin [Ectothiorhodospira mobilis]MCG5534652.1 type II toxin-antitoxin system RelE/ParE family toxin [Ectothiorhodospira mobilis]SFM69222.1 proteic killer suppression protein [Ectothiorhodospira mobilis]
MIVSIKHKGLKALYEKGSTKGVQQDHVKKLRRILANLDEAKKSQDMDLPGYKLHELKGHREGFWSVQVNGNWRVTWRFIGGDVELVNYEDYH